MLILNWHDALKWLSVYRTLTADSGNCRCKTILVLEREPRREVNAELKMGNETRVLIHAIVEA